jgi:hypothetical protein
MRINEGLPKGIHMDKIPHIKLMSSHHLIEDGKVIAITAMFHSESGRTNVLYIKDPNSPDSKKYMTPFQKPDETVQAATRISLLEAFGVEINQESVPGLKLLPTIRQPN